MKLPPDNMNGVARNTAQISSFLIQSVEYAGF